MGGALVFIGALTHLLLDEIYSIDFAGNRVKRSFGTAMKLYDYKKPASAFLMVCGLAGFMFIAPPIGNFYALVKSGDNWSYLANRLLPHGKWFDIKLLRIRLANSGEDALETTGSID